MWNQALFLRARYQATRWLFTHSLRTSSARAAHDAFAMEVTRRIPVEDYARTSPDVWRRLTVQKDATRNDLRVSTRAIYFAR